MKEINLADRYTLTEIIGEGSYSIVYKGRDKEKNLEVAVKKLKSLGVHLKMRTRPEFFSSGRLKFSRNFITPRYPVIMIFCITGTNITLLWNLWKVKTFLR